MIVAERTSVKHRKHTAIAAAEVTTASMWYVLLIIEDTRRRV